MMSAPFYTSETLPGENIDWSDIDSRKFPENIVTTCPGMLSQHLRTSFITFQKLNTHVCNFLNHSDFTGVVVRLWAKNDTLHSVPELIITWGVYFSGLVFMGSQLPKESALFLNNSLIFGTSWGYFVSEISLQTPLPQPNQTVSDNPSLSYTIPMMCR